MRGWWMLVAVSMGACGGRAGPPPEPVVTQVAKSAVPAPDAEGVSTAPDAAEAWAPSPSQEVMYRALSVRDPEPDCATVAASSPTPALDLLALVDHASQPPWVGMRAAGCLLSHHLDESREHVIGWMRTEATYGLALMTARQIGSLPEDVATAVVTAGLGGPADAEVREAAAQDERASVQALVVD